MTIQHRQEELRTWGLDGLIYHIIELSEQHGNPHIRCEAWQEIERRFDVLTAERDELLQRVQQLTKSGKAIIDAFDGKVPDLL